MMLKKKQGLILLIGYVLCTQLSHSQKIILSQEVHWKEKDLYLLNYNKPVIPFLRLIYTNNSTDSLYFYVGTDDVVNFLSINYQPDFLVNIDIDIEWKNILDSLPDWSKNEYVVSSSNNYPFEFQVTQKGCCKTKSQTGYDSNEHYLIDKLTQLLSFQNKLDSEGSSLQLKYFHHPNKKTEIFNDEYISKVKNDLKEEKAFIDKLISDSLFSKTWFENKSYNSCMFLKPGESSFIEFDLTPLFLLKGVYKFIIKPQLLNKTYKIIDYNFLPFKNGYKLFNGRINGVECKLVIDK